MNPPLRTTNYYEKCSTNYDPGEDLTQRRCRYDDLGGISGILQEVRELIEYPLVHPEVYAHLGIEPVRTMRCSSR